VNGDFDFSALLDDFADDANGHLDQVERSLLELEGRGIDGGVESPLVTMILGDLHTLKGNAGMMGLTPLQQYVHQLEGVLKRVGDGSLPLHGHLLEALFGGVNAVRRGVGRLAQEPGTELDFSDERMVLEVAATSATAACSTVETAAVPRPASQGEQGADFSYITRKSNTLKVNFGKLDELLNLMGELVIQRTALVDIEKRLREQVTDRDLLAAFSESSALIDKSATDLRHAIMKVRMLPVETVFMRFQRLVRDLSVRHGKEIQLRFEGEETELDKTVIDEIGEPLLHLIRNAVDHGIEPPAERLAKGKPQSGTLWLRARHESNHIVIAVADDGGGMSPEKIRRAAQEKGLVTAEAAEAMSEHELLNLVFLPGFSTSGELTETSGRGIGLDVVKKIVNSFNGSIEIDSRVGFGTTFTIRLPLTLAIISALMVEVAGSVYAMPLSAVEESIQVSEAEIHEVGQGEMIALRGKVLPLHRLDRFFGNPVTRREQQYVVVVSGGEKRGGLVVDRLLGQQEIVIKGLDDYLGELPGVSGATVLGDGRVSLIIDVGSVLRG
jgi:two-component system, chemotaxis family, sensor kinase CheA